MTRIGILGGGQLGRMLALAGYPLGFQFRIFDHSPQAPAAHLAECYVAEFSDESVLARFAQGLDVVTYEFENVPVKSVRFLAKHVPVFPSAEALETAQDRLHEKNLFKALSIPTPAFFPIAGDLDTVIQVVGLPALVKTRRFGYDGKGQQVVRSVAELQHALKSLGSKQLIAEQFVEFDRELSLIAVRNQSGTIAFYPLVENVHSDGILRLTRAPACDVSNVLQQQAEDYVTRVLEALNYVGVLALEFFQCGQILLANEMAPRVHNSGHWTIEGAETSQFENHLRAIAALPLGSAASRGFSAMANLIGNYPDLTALLRIPYAHVHHYGKTPQPGRKLGHVTLCAEDINTVDTGLRQLQQIIAS